MNLTFWKTVGYTHMRACIHPGLLLFWLWILAANSIKLFLEIPGCPLAFVK